MAITGIGFVTPLGCDLETVWSSLTQGRSGVGPITLFDASAFPTRIAAEVHGFDPGRFMDRKLARRVPRYCQLAVAAAIQALDDAGLDPSADPDEIGVIVSTAVGGQERVEANHEALLRHGVHAVSPLTVTTTTNSAAGLVALQCGCGGPNYAITSACASSAHGLGEAAEIVRRGDAGAMLAGGAEATITPLTIAAFCQLRAMSQRNDHPEQACRPFDLDRDGFVMAEGAVMMVLEDLDAARRRGARVRAVLTGFGASSDMYHLTAPRPDGRGAVRAMRRALAKAGVRPEEVDYVNAHATATRVGDVAEVRALKEVFGPHASILAVSSTKSMHGHLMGAAGAMEAACCVLAIERGVVPPTINLERPDPECDLDFVPNRARPAVVRTAISNSFGFGGHNACLVFEAADRKPVSGC